MPTEDRNAELAAPARQEEGAARPLPQPGTFTPERPTPSPYVWNIAAGVALRDAVRHLVDGDRESAVLSFTPHRLPPSATGHVRSLLEALNQVVSEALPADDAN